MTDLFKNKYRISPARLQTWDYADNGLYFITICTENRECFFGNIVEKRSIRSQTHISGNEMQLTNLGKVVEMEWLKTPLIRPDMNLELEEYVVMPNHFHGIIYIGENQFNTGKLYDNGYRKNEMNVASISGVENGSKNKFGPQYKSLSSIIRGFKSAVTTFARKNEIPFNWQARFHDHIITSNAEYLRIGQYIIDNIDKWHEDRFYNQ